MRIFQSTLPRRERPNHYAICIILYYFNPRSREGSDGSSHDVYKTLCQFQSTLPRRERQLDTSRIDDNLLISIHAPAKGATYHLAKIITFDYISIHAPAKGATETLEEGVANQQISIHAPAKGATMFKYLSVKRI